MASDLEFLFTPCAFTTATEIAELQGVYDADNGDKADKARQRLNEIGNVLDDPRAPIRDLLHNEFIQGIDEIFCRLLIDTTTTFGTDDATYFDKYGQYNVQVVESIKQYVVTMKNEVDPRKRLVLDHMVAKYQYLTHSTNKHFYAYVPLLTPSVIPMLIESLQQIDQAIMEVSNDEWIDAKIERDRCSRDMMWSTI